MLNNEANIGCKGGETQIVDLGWFRARQILLVDQSVGTGTAQDESYHHSICAMLESRPIQERLQFDRQICEDRIEHKGQVVDHFHKIGAWLFRRCWQRPSIGPLILAHAKKAVQLEPDLLLHPRPGKIDCSAKTLYCFEIDATS